MSPRQFYVANILSALAWAPAHVFPGVLLGMAISLSGATAEQLTLVVIAGLLLVWTVWGLVRRQLRGRSDRFKERVFVATSKHDARSARSARPPEAISRGGLGTGSGDDERTRPFAQADQQVTELKERIARQRDVVERAKQRGHSTLAAESMLRALERTLCVFEKLR
jgi:hypothetical protein